MFGGPARPENVVRQPALTTITNLGAQETQSSGVNEAFVGGLPNIIGQASRLLRTPSGAFGTGVGLSTALMPTQRTVSGTRITRKTKRMAQQAFNIAGGNLANAVVLFAQLTEYSF